MGEASAAEMVQLARWRSFGLLGLLRLLDDTAGTLLGRACTVSVDSSPLNAPRVAGLRVATRRLVFSARFSMSCSSWPLFCELQHGRRAKKAHLGLLERLLKLGNVLLVLAGFAHADLGEDGAEVLVDGLVVQLVLVEWQGLDELAERLLALVEAEREAAGQVAPLAVVVGVGEARAELLDQTLAVLLLRRASAST